MTALTRHELILIKHSCGLRAEGASGQPAPTDDSDGKPTYSICIPKHGTVIFIVCIY